MADNNEKKPVKSEKKSNKPGFGSKLGKFFRDYRSELKKISWPTFSEVVKNTVITLVTVLIVGAVIWVFDFVFGQARNYMLKLSSDKTATETVDSIDQTAEDALNELTEGAEDAEEAVGEVVEGAEEAVEEAVEGAEG